MKRFRDQVAVISGGADGLGKGIAERIASEGGAVALFDVNKKLLDATLGEFKDKGFDASGYEVDVSSEEMVSQNFEQLRSTFGKIAGIGYSANGIGTFHAGVSDVRRTAGKTEFAQHRRVCGNPKITLSLATEEE